MAWPGKNIAAWKEPFLWFCGGLMVFVLCLMLTFPYGALYARVIGELHRLTGMQVDATGWTVGIPLALEWQHVTISKSDWDPIQVGVMRAQVGILEALAGKVALDLSAQVDEHSAAQGVAKATLTASSWSLSGLLDVAGTIRQLDLSKLAPRYVTHGTLTGEFSCRFDGLPKAGQTTLGEGRWIAEVKDLSLDQIPAGNGRTLSLGFSTLSVGLSCREHICTVTELKGDGIDGSFSGEGAITLEQPILHSQLALSLTVIPGAGFAAKASGLGIPPLPPGVPLTLKVMGTLAQAKVAL